jgi:hypothetical protein
MMTDDGSVSLKSRVRQQESGSSVLEATITLSLLTTALFSLFQLAIVVFQQVGLQHALYMTGRFASLGPSSAGVSHTQQVEQRLIETARQFGLRLHNPGDIYICPVDIDNCDQNSAGGSGQLIVLRARQPISLFGRPVFHLTREVTVLNHIF